MRKHMTLGLFLLAALALGAGGPGMAQRGRPAPRVPTLTPVEASLIVHMREEEKLARDVYLTLGAIWQTRVFEKIADSESRHMAAVKKLITTYGLTDPVTNDAVGAFTDPKFRTLYARLVASGSTGLIPAYEAGVFIEEMDIEDLTAALDVVQQKDIRTVFDHLLDGSYSHLEAFESLLGQLGG